MSHIDQDLPEFDMWGIDLVVFWGAKFFALIFTLGFVEVHVILASDRVI